MRLLVLKHPELRSVLKTPSNILSYTQASNTTTKHNQPTTAAAARAEEQEHTRKQHKGVERAGDLERLRISFRTRQWEIRGIFVCCDKGRESKHITGLKILYL